MLADHGTQPGYMFLALRFQRKYSSLMQTLFLFVAICEQKKTLQLHVFAHGNSIGNSKFSSYICILNIMGEGPWESSCIRFLFYRKEKAQIHIGLGLGVQPSSILGVKDMELNKKEFVLYVVVQCVTYHQLSLITLIKR